MDIVRTDPDYGLNCEDRRLYFEGNLPEPIRLQMEAAMRIHCTLMCGDQIRGGDPSIGRGEFAKMSVCGAVQRLLELQRLADQ